MLYSEMKHGMRVRLVRDVDVYPDGLYRAGLLGTVDMRGTDDFIRGAVKLDQIFPELSEWDNCIMMYADIHGAAFFSPADIEPL